MAIGLCDASAPPRPPPQFSSCKHLTESDQTGHFLSRPLTSCCKVRAGSATESRQRTVSPYPRVRFSHVPSKRSGTSRWYERDAVPNRQGGTSKVFTEKACSNLSFAPHGLSTLHTKPQRRAYQVGQHCRGNNKGTIVAWQEQRGTSVSPKPIPSSSRLIYDGLP